MALWIKSTLRLPSQIHKALEAQAAEKDVSLNAHLVEILNKAAGGVFVSEDDANASNILGRLEKVEARLDALEKGAGK